MAEIELREGDELEPKAALQACTLEVAARQDC